MRGWSTFCAVGAFGVLLLAAAAGCTRTKKLSGEDTSIIDDFRYGVLGQDREAEDYYRIVRQSHESQRGGYRVTADEFLIDKTVDAVQRLGKLTYERLEGQAQVVDLLADVLLTDPSALAQANAANSLTRLTMKFPRTTVRRVADSGAGMQSRVRELDALNKERGAAGSARRTAQLVEELGRYRLPTSALARQALRPLYTRPYLVSTSDAAVRRAADRALVLRMEEVARLALRESIGDETAFVREEAVRGLKTIRDSGAEPLVRARLASEPNDRVRVEAVEYLGTVNSASAVATLLPLLEDSDPTICHKARQSLTRIAGRDLGFRRVTWTRWARERYPELAQPVAPVVPSQPGPSMR